MTANRQTNRPASFPSSPQPEIGAFLAGDASGRVIAGPWKDTAKLAAVDVVQSLVELARETIAALHQSRLNIPMGVTDDEVAVLVKRLRGNLDALTEVFTDVRTAMNSEWIEARRARLGYALRTTARLSDRLCEIGEVSRSDRSGTRERQIECLRDPLALAIADLTFMRRVLATASPALTLALPLRPRRGRKLRATSESSAAVVGNGGAA